MAILLLLTLILLGLSLSAFYLLGFRLGGESCRNELERIRSESHLAERRLHELTRSAFIAMAEEAQNRRAS